MGRSQRPVKGEGMTLSRKMSSWWAYGLVAFGASCISFAGPLVKWIDAGPTVIGFYRTAIASVALGTLSVLSMARAPSGEQHSMPSSWKPAIWAVLAGACFAGDLFVWHRSILAVGAGLATLLANTHVFWVAVFSAIFLGERLTWKFGLCVIVALGGVALLLIPSEPQQEVYLHGLGLGLMTGVFYAGYYLCLRQSQRFERSLSPVPNLAVASMITASFLFCGVLGVGESLALPETHDLLLLCVLGVGVHACGWLAISRGIPHVAAGPGSFILLLQTVLAAVWGFLWLGEVLGPRELLGGVITLGAIYGATLVRRDDTEG